ncbi:MAG: hypothetical protein JRI68_28845 [Deltaproteobacteria bacterium]|nr:hypothetical protein [Deltaproteobacteria bacterium]
MSRHPSGSIVLALVLASAAGLCVAEACGGTTVVDGGAAGGGGSGASSSGNGGAGASSSSSGSSTSSSSSSSSGVGGGTEGLCALACDQIDACLEPGVDCEARCQASAAGCVQQHSDWLECFQALSSPTCAFPEACEGELAALLACRGVFQTAATCGALPGGDCDCQVSDMDFNSYGAVCTKNGAANDCTCTFGTQVLGDCSFDGATQCDPFRNCCRTLLFVPGFP